MQDDVYVADDGSRCCVLTIMDDDAHGLMLVQDAVCCRMMSMLLMMVQDVVC